MFSDDLGFKIHKIHIRVAQIVGFRDSSLSSRLLHFEPHVPDVPVPDLRDLLLQRVSGHKSPLFKSAVRACAEQKPWEEVLKGQKTLSRNDWKNRSR